MICSAGRETGIKPSKSRMAKVGLFVCFVSFFHCRWFGTSLHIKLFTFVVCILYLCNVSFFVPFGLLWTPQAFFYLRKLLLSSETSLYYLQRRFPPFSQIWSDIGRKRKSSVACTSCYNVVSRPLTLHFSSLLHTEAWDLVSGGSSCKCSARLSCYSCSKLSASSSGTNLIEPEQWGKRVWRDVQRCVPINSERRRRAEVFGGRAKKSGLCKSEIKKVCAFSAWPGHSSCLLWWESSCGGGGGGGEKWYPGHKGFHPQRSSVRWTSADFWERNRREQKKSSWGQTWRARLPL